MREHGLSAFGGTQTLTDVARIGVFLNSIGNASPQQVRTEGRRWTRFKLHAPKRPKFEDKRQPPAPIPPRLLAHLRRWQRLGLAGSHFVEFNGKPVKSVKTAFARAVSLAKLSGHGSKIVPHTLRHTAATWLMQRGVPAWAAAGYLGMSTEIIERVYGHHSPDHLMPSDQR